MKRLILIVVLVAACLGLLAAPLWAGAAEPPGFMIGLYESAPFSAPIDQNYIWANGAGYDPYGDWYGMLPSYKSGHYLQPYAGWSAYGKGRIQNVPKVLLVSLDLYTAPVDGAPLGAPILSLSPQEAKAFWLEPYLVDPVEWGWPAFNPQLGAKLYVRWWLFTAPPFKNGDYLLHLRYDFKHPTFSLCLIQASVHGPYKFMPGDKDWAWDAWYSFAIMP